MCDEYRVNSDHLLIDSNERVVKNSEIDQQWADWLAPTRRSFLFGAGAASVGLTLGEGSARRHLYYTLWVNRSQPVNVYNLKAPRDKDGKARIEKIFPNVTSTIRIEV
jgi:hypothetical protein